LRIIVCVLVGRMIEMEELNEEDRPL
jgi:hypothetical protein